MKQEFISIESGTETTTLNAHNISAYVTTSNSIKIYLLSGTVITCENRDPKFIQNVIRTINETLGLKFERGV